MSTKTAAALEEALDAHIREEFPGDHDGEHLVSWAVVVCYSDFDEPQRGNYSADGKGRNHETAGLFHVGLRLMDDAEDD